MLNSRVFGLYRYLSVFFPKNAEIKALNVQKSRFLPVSYPLGSTVKTKANIDTLFRIIQNFLRQKIFLYKLKNYCQNC